MSYDSKYAEHYIIGAILISNSKADEAIGIVSPIDFYGEDERDIYKACITLRSKGEPIDIITLSELQNSLPSGESMLSLAAMIHKNAYSTENLARHCELVKSYATRRAWRHQISELITQADMSDIKPDELIAMTDAAMRSLAEGKAKTANVHVGSGLKAVVDDIIERMEHGNKPRGLVTGLPDLDAILQGLRAGQMIVVAGRPGAGKTTLAMNIAEYNALHGNLVQVFSLEMTLHELNTRQLASIGKVPMSNIATGNVADYMTNITAWKSRVESMPMMVCEKGGLGMPEIRAMCRLQKQAGDLKLVVIDYIGLIRTHGSKTSNRTQELGAVSRECKEMAKELGVPVIVLAQLNREIEKGGERDPRLSDLRDSGEIEQDADIVMFVSKAQEDGVSKVTVAKHRHAKPGNCFLLHRGDLSRFDCMAKGYEPPAQTKPKSARGMI